jgi:DnaK suppressor protein
MRALSLTSVECLLAFGHCFEDPVAPAVSGSDDCPMRTETYWEFHEDLIFVVKKREFTNETRLEYQVVCPHCERLHNVYPSEAGAWLSEHFESCISRSRAGDLDDVDQWAIRRYAARNLGYRRTRRLSVEFIRAQRGLLQARRQASERSFEEVARRLKQKSPDAHELSPQRANTDELMVANENLRRLHAIDAALDRLRGGTYGVCLDCQGDIEDERLRALPFAVLCKTCALRLQEQGMRRT